MRIITAVEMAKRAGIDPKRFRRALRREISWHRRNERWTVEVGSSKHDEMERVLRGIKDLRKPKT